MKVIALLLFATLAAISCSSNTEQADGSIIDGSIINEVSFTCDNGSLIQVQFFNNEERAILSRNEKTTVLQQQPSASGFHYSSGSTSIRGKSKALTVLIDKMAAINCTVQ